MNIFTLCNIYTAKGYYIYTAVLKDIISTQELKTHPRHKSQLN